MNFFIFLLFISEWKLIRGNLDCGGDSEYSKEKNKCLPATAKAPCNEGDAPCHPDTGLKCSSDYVCACPDPKKQVFIKSEVLETKSNFGGKVGRCLSMPDQGCDTSKRGGEPQCVPDANCGDDGICHCIYKYTPMRIPLTDDVVCRQDWLEVCWGDNCNTVAGLTCSEGRCRCKDEGMIYNEDRKQCVKKHR